jgi:hypothetical protein
MNIRKASNKIKVMLLEKKENYINLGLIRIAIQKNTENLENVLLKLEFGTQSPNSWDSTCQVPPPTPKC